MKLEDQVAALAEVGLMLNEGITIDDLLISWSRSDYEHTPFDMVLFAYGSEVEGEPWGRYICDSAWNFDAECIDDNGSYEEIVNQFHRITGKRKTLEDLIDKVDIEAEIAQLHYTVDGVKRDFDITVDNDWADSKTCTAIMDDMSDDEHEFYAKENGQAVVWFYMKPENAHTLNALANNVFGLDKKPTVVIAKKAKPWWQFW